MKIRLCNGGKDVNLKIEDNGHGLDPEQLAQSESGAPLGVGIAGMRERVRQLNGTFEIHSSSCGTRLEISLPSNKEQNAAYSAG
jgi:signal transduction histidine kinase